MNLDKVAKRLGYDDAEHLVSNIENYGEPLPQWWEVIKELVNKLPLNDVIVSQNYHCYNCQSTNIKTTKYKCRDCKYEGRKG